MRDRCGTGISIVIILTMALTGCIKEGIAPVADFTYTPGEGSRYSIFYFDASGSYDLDNAAYSLKYRWDFDGDGEFDTDFTEFPKANFKYPVVECFNVVLEVIDPEGNISELVKELCVSNKNNTPYPILDLLPPLASLGTEVTLDASRSFDWEEPSYKLLVRWDLDGDKIWDTGFSDEKTIKRLFNPAGFYTITMEIIDSEGASAIVEKVLEVANTYNEYNYLTDYRDDHVYGIVKIGDQWVMAQNLVYGIL